MSRMLGFCGFLFLFFSIIAGGAEDSKKDLQAYDIWNKPRELSEYLGAADKYLVLAFFATDCPICKLHANTLKELESRFRPQGVKFLLLFPNDGDSLNAIGLFGLDFDLPIPLLKDYRNKVADAFKVERTPEVIVVNPAMEVAYRGQIDDRYWAGGRRAEASEHFLRSALEALIAGKAPEKTSTPALGCHVERWVARKSEGKLNYAENVAPIFEAKCVACHRDKGIAPFSLEDYARVKKRARMIEEVVELERMPPWQAVMDEKKFGGFLNDKRLTLEEKNTLLDWIAQGFPEGKPIVQPKREYSSWSIGKPDAIIEMEKPFDVPADEELEYQYIPVATKFDRDIWIQAAQAQAGTPAVVHHINVHITPGGQRPRTGILQLFQLFGLTGKKASLLASFIPGDADRHYPKDYAVLIPKGHDVTFELHYTPNGIATTDLSRVGMIFATEKPKFQIRSHLLVERKILVPADDSHYVKSASTTFDKKIRLLSVRPHMHKRGKHFRYELVYPDGKREVLLTVPRWDFNWQSIYEFKTPVEIPAGTEIIATAHWDNSYANPANNPKVPLEEIGWGLQTYEEMMNGGLTYAEIDE